MIRERASKPDFLLAIIVFLLSIFGIVMISSASIVLSQEKFGSNFHYVTQQIVSLVIGLFGMVIAYFIDYRAWRKAALTFFLITLVLMIAVFIPHIGLSFGGAHRWIGIGGQTLQPSEILKLSFIIYLATWLEKRGEAVSHLSVSFIPFVFLLLVLGFLIMSQPDLGTFIVLMLTAIITFFVAGANLKHLAVGAVGVAGALGLLIITSSYRLQRFLVFLNPSAEKLGAAYHINQALIAIGSGGIWGLGYGQSKQKYLYLPEPHVDSIFAIITEELGFIRAALVLLVYVFIAIRGYRIAKAAPDTFAKLLAIGITSWIVVQAFVNIAAMLSLVPLTGVPLPFISSGGTSLIVNLFAIGILLNISKFSRLHSVGAK